MAILIDTLTVGCRILRVRNSLLLLKDPPVIPGCGKW
jgi:hypothetical protein